MNINDITFNIHANHYIAKLGLMLDIYLLYNVTFVQQRVSAIKNFNIEIQRVHSVLR